MERAGAGRELRFRALAFVFGLGELTRLVGDFFLDVVLVFFLPVATVRGLLAVDFFFVCRAMEGWLVEIGSTGQALLALTASSAARGSRGCVL